MPQGIDVLSDEMKAQLAGLEGLISEEVGLTLADLAAQVRADHAIVEIGSYKGKSTAYLAAGSLNGNGARVHAIDPWTLPGNAGGRFGFDRNETLNAFKEQLLNVGLWPHVTPLRMFSVKAAEAWVTPIGLLYIDGSHTEKDVRADWMVWGRHLGFGGVVVFDDYDTPRNPGVKKVVDSIKGEWEYEPRPLAIRRAS